MKITLSRSMGMTPLAVVEIDERGNEIIVPADDFRRPAYRNAVERRHPNVDWAAVDAAFAEVGA